MTKNESPLVAFRIPKEVVERLISDKQINENYTKPDLSNFVKAVFLERYSESYQVSIDSEFLHDLADNAIESKQAVEVLEQKIESLQSHLEELIDLREKHLSLELSAIANKFTRLRLRKDYQKLAQHTKLIEAQEYLLAALTKLEQMESQI